MIAIAAMRQRLTPRLGQQGRWLIIRSSLFKRSLILKSRRTFTSSFCNVFENGNTPRGV